MSDTPRIDEIDGAIIVRYTFGVFTLQVNEDREFPVTMGTAALMIVNRSQARSIARIILEALDATERKSI